MSARSNCAPGFTMTAAGRANWWRVQLAGLNRSLLRNAQRSLIDPWSQWNDRLPICSIADYSANREEARRRAAWVPVKSGDRQDRSARRREAGALLPGWGPDGVWVPDAAHEALRDLVRARLAAKRDQLRARHRMGEFLLRQGRRAPEGTTAWTGQYLTWIKQQRFDQPAQQATLLDYPHEVEHLPNRLELVLAAE
jgi:hypothetical protein